MSVTLTTEQIEQYKADGYLTPIRMLPEAEGVVLRAKLEAFEAKQGGSLEPTQRSKSHLLFKWLDDLIRDPRAHDPVEQLIGPNIFCWNTIFWIKEDIFCWNTIFWIKEAHSPSFVSWHQDTKYWGLSSDKVLTVWLALFLASLESGCMRVMPETHIGEVLEHEDRYHEDNMLTRGQEISGKIDETREVHMPMEVGEMSIHNYRLAHASGPNNSDDRRIGVQSILCQPRRVRSSVIEIARHWSGLRTFTEIFLIRRYRRTTSTRQPSNSMPRRRRQFKTLFMQGPSGIRRSFNYANIPEPNKTLGVFIKQAA